MQIFTIMEVIVVGFIAVIFGGAIFVMWRTGIGNFDLMKLLCFPFLIAISVVLIFKIYITGNGDWWNLE